MWSRERSPRQQLQVGFEALDGLLLRLLSRRSALLAALLVRLPGGALAAPITLLRYLCPPCCPLREGLGGPVVGHALLEAEGIELLLGSPGLSELVPLDQEDAAHCCGFPEGFYTIVAHMVSE